MLKLDEIVAFTFSGNSRSEAVMTRLGVTRNPADDFIYQGADGHPRPSVLYRIENQALAEKETSS